MKSFYTIGEVAKLLGTTIDAIRFYEKKGLVHPEVNQENNYRHFTITNILELLDIIYYRHLDMSISDISTILMEGNRDIMKDMIMQKRIETQHRIRYEQQLVKKLEYIESIYTMITNPSQVCQIHPFPSSVILSKGNAVDTVIMRQLMDMSKDEFVLSTLHQTYSLASKEVEEVQILIEQDIVKDMNFFDVALAPSTLPSRNCIHRVVQMVDFKVSDGDVKALLDFAQEQSIQCEDWLYIKEVPLTSYADSNNYYAELFLPICE